MDRGFHLLRDDRYGWMGLYVENWEKKITRSGGSIPRCSYVSNTREQGSGRVPNPKKILNGRKSAKPFLKSEYIFPGLVAEWINRPLLML